MAEQTLPEIQDRIAFLTRVLKETDIDDPDYGKLWNERAQLKAEEARLIQPWPKEKTLYIHGSKDDMWNLGEELGLKEEALQLFRHALTEVKVVISVKENGTYQIKSFEG